MELITDLFNHTRKMRATQRKYVTLRSEGKQDWQLLQELKAQESLVDIILEKIHKAMNPPDAKVVSISGHAKAVR